MISRRSFLTLCARAVAGAAMVPPVALLAMPVIEAAREGQTGSRIILLERYEDPVVIKRSVSLDGAVDEYTSYHDAFQNRAETGNTYPLKKELEWVLDAEFKGAVQGKTTIIVTHKDGHVSVISELDGALALMFDGVRVEHFGTQELAAGSVTFQTESEIEGHGRIAGIALVDKDGIPVMASRADNALFVRPGDAFHSAYTIRWC